MRPITLNLATRPFRNNTVVGSVISAAAAALILATVSNLYFFLHYGGADAQVRQQETADRDRFRGVENDERALSREIQGRDFRRLYERGKFANDLILRRSFSWTLLFNRLETVVPPDVMMTAIRPNITADAIVVRIDGLAKNQGAFIALQDRLVGNLAFARVYPISERKLNPSRSDITFALNFGYLPKVTAAPSEVVASSVPAAGAPPGNGMPPAPGSPAPLPPPAQQATASPPTRTPAIGFVGRDGRERTAALLDRLLVAPGGVYAPRGAVPHRSGQDDAKRKRSQETSGHKAAAPGTSAPGPSATGRAAAAQGVPQTVAAARPGGTLPVPRGPGSTPALVPGAAAKARTDDFAPGAVPAARLDVALRFSGRPVGEIYDALSRAHGVQFKIDPGVDPQTHVSADLSGKSLPEAIVIVARAAGHRVSRQADGVYRVVVASGGEPIADKPIREETLAPVGAKP